MNDYIANGKQILLGRDHIADACDETTAARIASALNLYESGCRDGFEPVAFVDTPSGPVEITNYGDPPPDADDYTLPLAPAGHVCTYGARQETDEHVCTNPRCL